MTTDVEVLDGAMTRSVVVEVGETLRVSLPSTASTGYDWQVQVPAGGIASTDSGTFLSGGPAPGAAGFKLFTLRAQKPGHATLTFALARAWETKPPIEVAELDLTVR